MSVVVTLYIVLMTYMYLYANCKSPNQFDIMINTSRWRIVLLDYECILLISS